jgi:prepilin-type N-terminal cleavage/methylation domain-containing protein
LRRFHRAGLQGARVGGRRTAVAPGSEGRSRGHAFTLIEVLIGVLVLAIGLLGLGAIIPVVVRQQRLASESTLSVSAAMDARSYLTSRAAFNPAGTKVVGGVESLDRSAWDRWLDNANWSPATGAGQFRWEPWDRQEFDRGGVGNLTGTPDQGRMIFTVPGASPVYAPVLTVGDRLWPTGARTPLFVWDIVGRRLPSAAATIPPGGSDEPQALQIALFLRRVDMNVRVPAGRTLREVLTGGAGNSSRFPVAVDNGGVSTGYPTNNGYGDYARPLVVGAQVVTTNPTGRRNWILIGGPVATPAITPLAAAQALASATGQKLVDNFGNVYTVLGVRDPADVPAPQAGEVVVEPEVPSWVNAAPVGGGDYFKQVVFVPQVPAAVQVFTVSRPAR